MSHIKILFCVFFVLSIGAYAQDGGVNIQAAPSEVVQNTVSPTPVANQQQTNQPNPQAQTNQPVKTTQSKPAVQGNIHTLQNLTEQQKQKLLKQEQMRLRISGNETLKQIDNSDLSDRQKEEAKKRLVEQSARNSHKHYLEITERRRKDKQENQRLLREGGLSKTDQFKLRQKLREDQMHQQFYALEEQQGNRNNMNTYMFELDPDTQQDFRLSLPIAQNIFFRAITYINEEGVYSKAKTIENEDPVKVFVYENNSVLEQFSFYYNTGYYFKGKANATYTIKFVNSIKHRLIDLTISSVLQEAHIGKAITVEKANIHEQMVTRTYSSLAQRFGELEKKFPLEMSNRKNLSSQIRTYSYYSIVEIVVVAALCVIQVELIRKLLNRSSVV